MQTTPLLYAIAEMRVGSLWTIMAGIVKSKTIVMMNEFQNIINHQKQKKLGNQNVIIDAPNIVKTAMDS